MYRLTSDGLQEIADFLLFSHKTPSLFPISSIPRLMSSPMTNMDFFALSFHSQI